MTAQLATPSAEDQQESRFTGCNVTSVSSGTIYFVLGSNLTISRKMRTLTARTVWGSTGVQRGCQERDQRTKKGVKVEVTWTQISRDWATT